MMIDLKLENSLNCCRKIDGFMVCQLCYLMIATRLCKIYQIQL